MIGPCQGGTGLAMHIRDFWFKWIMMFYCYEWGSLGLTLDFCLCDLNFRMILYFFFEWMKNWVGML